jgi:hypothetical protein
MAARTDSTKVSEYNFFSSIPLSSSASFCAEGCFSTLRDPKPNDLFHHQHLGDPTKHYHPDFFCLRHFTFAK